MKQGLLTLFIALSLICKSQDINSTKPDEGVRKEQDAGMKNETNSEAAKPIVSTPVDKNIDGSVPVINPESRDKIEQQKSDTKTSDKKVKKGRRGGNSNTILFVVIGIAVVALVVYLVTSASTTKM